MNTTEATTRYDVAIIGTGIAGSMLGAILARNGLRVLLLDAGAHPKFAVGESTIPYTLVALRTIAERYDVPEIKTLATFTDCTKVLGPHFGVKKHFSFLLHEKGKEQNPKWVNQFNTPGLLHEASHLFRQETDAYMFHVAIRYGCIPRQQVKIGEVDIDGSGVTLSCEDGSTYLARYVVDASGFRSPLADQFGLREKPTRLKHHSRSLFTHMVGVTPTDDIMHHPASERPPVPWYEGTVHHMFERGWFWVIGFDNHKSSNNPLCSVGLTFDPRVYPKDDSMTPEEEFRYYASLYPAVERQFQGAKSVREWVSTDRLQYSASTSIGDRYCLMAHAYGFIDPLFSRGLSNTAEVINSLAWRLIAASEDDDFSAERFEYVSRLEAGLLDYNDDLVNSAFISFSDYDLWNAVFRVWAYGSNLGTFRLQDAITKYWKTGDDNHFLELEDPPNLGLWWPDHQGYKALFDLMVEQCESFERGEITSSAAAETLFSAITSADFIPPPMGFTDRHARFLNPTPAKMAKTAAWMVREAPPELRELGVGVFLEAGKAKLRGGRLF